METDQAVQLDVLLNKSSRSLNKSQGAAESDTSTTTKIDNRSPSSLDNSGTHTAIAMTEKKDTDVTSKAYKPKSTMEIKSRVALKMKYSISHDKGGYDLHPAIGGYNPPYCYSFIANSGIPDY